MKCYKLIPETEYQNFEECETNRHENFAYLFRLSRQSLLITYIYVIDVLNTVSINNK